MSVTSEDVLSLARRAVEAEVSGKGFSGGVPDGMGHPAGAFVTLRSYPSGDLRGCIGYPEPAFPLHEAIVRSAASACRDPRFPPLGEDELDRITVEVTVLSVPERMEGGEGTPEGVIIGKHGLIIEARGRRGLLLPQVPAEWGWDIGEYLENLSLKAGLPADAWTWDDSAIYRFTGDIFSEDAPGGTGTRTR